MFFHPIYWCFSIFAMISCHLEVDVSPSHMIVILLWFSISLLGVMFYYSFYWCLAIFAMTLLSFSRCFAIAHLFEADVSPSHMFFILLWFSISLLGVIFCHLVYWCFPIFAMIPYYLIADVSPSHIFLKLMFRHRTWLLSYFDSQYHC